MIAVGGVVNYKDDDGIVAMMMAAMCHVIIHEFRRREITRLVHQMLIQLGPRLKRHFFFSTLAFKARVENNIFNINQTAAYRCFFSP